MREFKFRAWHHGGGDPRVEGAMYLSDPNNEMFWGRVDNEPHVAEVMQYTGLKDNNGVEIYEDDIVSIPTVFGVKPFKITFTVDRDFNGWEILPQHIEDGAEVIGNIHENPERLKRKDKDNG